MNIYECITILDAGLNDEAIGEALKRIQGTITGGGGEILKTDPWGRRKLAYEINHHQRGYYVLFLYRAPFDLNKKLETLFKVYDPVVKFMLMRLEKKQAEASLEALEREKKAAEAAAAAPAPAEVAAEPTPAAPAQAEQMAPEKEPVKASAPAEEKSPAKEKPPAEVAAEPTPAPPAQAEQKAPEKEPVKTSAPAEEKSPAKEKPPAEAAE